MRKQAIRMFSMFGILLVVFSFFGCAPSRPTPLLYAVTSEGGATVYLFGSVHAGKANTYPLQDGLLAAFDESDYLAVEVDISNMLAPNTQEEALDTLDDFLYEGDTTLADEIGMSLYTRVEEALKKEYPRFDLSLYTQYKPYFFQALFEQIAFEESGLSGEKAVDLYFIARAKDTQKEVLEIETADFQMKMLANMPTEISIYMLESALDIDAAAANLQASYEIWAIGDEQLWTDTMQEATPEGISEEMYDTYLNIVIRERNIGMADFAEEQLRENRNVFLVVGGGHIFGDGGLVDLLRDRGYTVEKVDYAA